MVSNHSFKNGLKGHTVQKMHEKREKIDIFNKKAIFIYVKEIADVNSITITKVIKQMKEIYKSILNEHIENFD